MRFLERFMGFIGNFIETAVFSAIAFGLQIV